MVNRVFLIGNLAADPEVRATPAGVHVANFRLATNTYAGRDPEGNAKQHTEFHHLVLFGRLAEVAGDHLRKGRLIHAEGRLQTRSWEGEDGKKHYRTEVVADSFTLLGARPGDPAGAVDALGRVAVEA